MDFTSLTPWATLKLGSVPLIGPMHIPQRHYKTQPKHRWWATRGAWTLLGGTHYQSIGTGPSPPTRECHPHSHAYSPSSPCFGRRMAGNPPGFGLFFPFLWQGPRGISCDATGQAWLLCQVVRLRSQGLACLACYFHVVGLLNGVQRASWFLLCFLFKSPFPTVSVLPNIALVFPRWQTLNMDS